MERFVNRQNECQYSERKISVSLAENQELKYIHKVNEEQVIADAIEQVYNYETDMLATDFPRMYNSDFILEKVRGLLVNSLVMNELIIILLKNIGSFSITMFGVEITIFTVIYSFIVSKRSYYKAISHDAKIQQSPSTYLYTEIKFAVKYMKSLKKLNLFVLALALVSLILYGWSLLISPIPDENSDILLSHKILGYFSVFYIIATLILLIIYIIKYFKEVKL